MDPRTTILIGSITCGLMALMLTSLFKAAPLPVPGLRTWVVGAWLIFVGLLMLGLRDWIPDLASVTVGNCLLMLAYLAWLAGTLEHFGQRMQWLPWLAAVAVATAAVTWIVFSGQEEFRLRAIVIAGLCAAINVRHALVVMRLVRKDASAKAIGIVMTAIWLDVLSLVYSLRAIHALVLPQGERSLLTQDVLQAVYTGSFTICNLMLVIAFATMASDYVRACIEEQVIRDPLTGVLNRRALFSAMGLELSRSQRYGRAFCVAMLDIDHFKSINDRFGHLMGDRVLTAMCKKVVSMVRPHDVFARYGGEEFLILMPETDLPAAALVAQRLLDALAVTGAEAEAEVPAITVSIGLAEWSAEDVSTETLVARADGALYAAKRNGRNRMEFATALTAA